MEKLSAHGRILRVLKNIRYRIPQAPSLRRHIFIVGVPRSGTTLLKSILAAHPEIGGSDYESTGIFGLRDIFAYAMGEVPPEQMQGYLAASSDIIAFYDTIADRLLDRTGKQIFVDKLQMRAYRFWYVRHYFPNALFVHIVRDGRDCYCSALGHPNVPQSNTLSKFARYWSRSVRLPEKHLPAERLYTVRYEDLTQDSEGTVKQLMSFLGIGFHSQQIDAQHFSATTSIKKRDVHQNLAKPISNRSQGRWRNELTPEQQAQFRKIAGASLARFGYALDSAETHA